MPPALSLTLAKGRAAPDKVASEGCEASCIAWDTKKKLDFFSGLNWKGNGDDKVQTTETFERGKTLNPLISAGHVTTQPTCLETSLETYVCLWAVSGRDVLSQVS